MSVLMVSSSILAPGGIDLLTWAWLIAMGLGCIAPAVLRPRR